MKKLGLLTVALVLSMALPVFGAEYVGEVRDADDYVDFFADFTAKRLPAAFPQPDLCIFLRFIPRTLI